MNLTITKQEGEKDPPKSEDFEYERLPNNSVKIIPKNGNGVVARVVPNGILKKEKNAYNRVYFKGEVG